MKRTLSFSFSMVLLSVAVAPCGGPTPASAATLAHNRASCLSSDVSGDDAVIACTAKPDRNRGVLEALLIRARAPQGAKLSAMPKVTK